MEYQFNLGYALGSAGKFVEALPHMEKAVELSGGKQWQTMAMLGAAYYRAGRTADAIAVTKRALEAAQSEGNTEGVRSLREALARFEAPKN